MKHEVEPGHSGGDEKRQSIGHIRKLFTAAAGVGLALVLWLLRASWRVRVQGSLPARGAYLIAFWHGEQALLLGARPAKLTGLASQSRDGRLAAGVYGRLGLRTIAGSSSRGGLVALRQLQRCVRAGDPIALALDGPRGPAGSAKAGALRLAQRESVPIVVVRAWASRAWRLRSWDRFALAWPFARVLVTIAAPWTAVGIAAELTSEAERRLGDAHSEWAAVGADAAWRAGSKP